jgi:hypothetical protein
MTSLDLYWRVFTEPPIRVSGLRTRTVEELCNEVVRAREAGIAAVIIDANFSSDIECGQDWAALPDRLAAAVEAAR